MNELERQKRLVVADAVTAARSGRLARRDFLRLCARAGFSLGGAAYLGACRRSRRKPERDEVEATQGEQSASTPGSRQKQFLEEVGGRYRGTRLVVVGEDTPPSRATIALLEEEFTPLTGIEVTWERLPLDRVLAKVSSATARQAPTSDIFYLDQAWVGRFVEDTLDPRRLMEKSDLAYPDYDFDDVLPALVAKTASYQGRLLGIPFDIPIQILQYRRDLFDELDLAVPTTLAAYTGVVRAIHEAKAPHITGTVGQWKSGHYSLVVDAASWLWAHGGSFFGADGRARLGEEAAEAAMRYMLELGKYMPPEVTTWTWDDQAQALAQGRSAMMLGAGEWFSLFDDPAQSKVVGLIEAAPCPREIALRPARECGFDETPGISRQGGSCLAVSRYSEKPDAAWVFLQWATSADITTRASLLGGGASPIRRSNYDDPRIEAAAKGKLGPTRHFTTTLDAIENRMGTEPHLPAWSRLVEEHFAVELGKMTTGQQDIRTTLANMAEVAHQSP